MSSSKYAYFDQKLDPNPLFQSVMPSDRPTAEALLTEYRRIFEVARRHHEDQDQFDDDQFDEEI